MRAFADIVISVAPPPLMVTMVFLVAYVLVGIPLQFTRGPAARDVFGTLAGVFAALIYITLVMSFYPDVHAAHR